MPLQEKDLQKYFQVLDTQMKTVGNVMQPFMTTHDQRDRLRKVTDAIGLREPAANQRLISEMAQVQRGTHVASTLAESTASIIETIAVFRDGESSDQEKGSAVLKVFGSFSQLAALAGPVGLAVGTSISTFLGMLSMILEATAPERETMIEKFEKVVRAVQGENAAKEVAAARSLFELQESALDTFTDEGHTWSEIMGTAPLTSDISTFALYTTARWLANPKNHEVEQWEETFVGYCRTLEEVFALYTTVLAKLVPSEHATLLAVSRKFGEHVIGFLEEVREQVSSFGQHWHIGEPQPYGYRATSFTRPKWIDSDIGSVGNIVLGPRGDRIWVHRHDGTRPLQTEKLKADGSPAGKPKDVAGLRGCTDLSILPGSSGGRYHVMAVQGSDPTGQGKPYVGKLMMNQWRESDAKFSSASFWTQELGDTTGRGGGVVMARAFEASPRLGEAPVKHVYVVRRSASASSLFYVTEEALLANKNAVTPSAHIAVIPSTAGNHFRIAVSDSHLYVYSDHAIHRKTHAEALEGSSSWQAVELPKNTGVLFDLSPWSEDGAIAIFGREIWNAEIPAEPTAGTSNVAAKWSKCKSGSGVKVLKKEHKSAEYFDAVLKIARGYQGGTELARRT